MTAPQPCWHVIAVIRSPVALSDEEMRSNVRTNRAAHLWDGDDEAK